MHRLSKWCQRPVFGRAGSSVPQRREKKWTEATRKCSRSCEFICHVEAVVASDITARRYWTEICCTCRNLLYGVVIIYTCAFPK